MAIFAAFIFPLSFDVGQAGAEGERYERLDIPVPEVETDKPGQRGPSATSQVIVSAFTRVNSKLDHAKAALYAEHVLEASENFSVHPFMIASIIIRESTVKQDARSKYAYGLMQINWKAHKKGLRSAFSHIQTIDDLIQPRNNILVGTWIFSWYLRSSDGNINKALEKYLGRSGKKYVSRVLAVYEGMLKEYTKREKARYPETPDISLTVAFAVK